MPSGVVYGVIFSGGVILSGARLRFSSVVWFKTSARTGWTMGKYCVSS